MRQRTDKFQNPRVRAGRNGGPRAVWRWILRVHSTAIPALLALCLNGLTAQAQASREYQLKAVFLYNFAQFTEWPESAFDSEKAPIVIGILGNDPFGRALGDTVRGESVQGRPLAVEHYTRADQIKTCHILFISQADARRTNEIVRSLNGKPILTVADTEGPSTSAAIIQFIVESNKVHFRVNQNAAAAANITLSSKLLRVADATPPEREP
jgi:hypothetical protein